MRRTIMADKKVTDAAWALLHFIAPSVHTAQVREQGNDEEALLGLPYVFLGSGQFQAMVGQAREGALLDLAGYLGDEPLRRILQHRRLQRESPPALTTLHQRTA